MPPHQGILIFFYILSGITAGVVIGYLADRMLNQTGIPVAMGGISGLFISIYLIIKKINRDFNRRER